MAETNGARATLTHSESGVTVAVTLTIGEEPTHDDDLGVWFAEVCARAREDAAFLARLGLAPAEPIVLEVWQGGWRPGPRVAEPALPEVKEPERLPSGDHLPGPGIAPPADLGSPTNGRAPELPAPRAGTPEWAALKKQRADRSAKTTRYHSPTSESAVTRRRSEGAGWTQALVALFAERPHAWLGYSELKALVQARGLNISDSSIYHRLHALVEEETLFSRRSTRRQSGRQFKREEWRYNERSAMAIPTLTVGSP